MLSEFAARASWPCSAVSTINVPRINIDAELLGVQREGADRPGAEAGIAGSAGSLALPVAGLAKASAVFANGTAHRRIAKSLDDEKIQQPSGEKSRLMMLERQSNRAASTFLVRSSTTMVLSPAVRARNRASGDKANGP
jgi:hypothetical protein